MKKTIKLISAFLLSLLDRLILMPIPADRMPFTQKATVKLSALVTDIKGKVGGSVFQGSKTGTTLKNKPSGNFVKSIAWTQGNPITAAVWDNSQSLALDLSPGLTAPDGSQSPQTVTYTAQRTLRQITKFWQTLSPSDRAAWDAAAINFPFKNRYGQSYTGSGFQVFTSINSKLFPLNVAPQTLPPSASDGDLATWPWNTISVSTDPASGSFLQLLIPDGICPGAIVIVNAHPPLSNGKLKTVFGGKGQIANRTAAPSTTELLPSFEQLFGTAIIGSTINFTVNVVNLSNGHVVYTANFAQQIPTIANNLKLKTVFGGRYALTPSPVIELQFAWSNGDQAINLGSFEVDHESDAFTYILSILQLSPNEAILLKKGGTYPNDFALSYNSLDIDSTSGLTVNANNSGSFASQPINIVANPGGMGSRSCTLTISSASLLTPVVWTINVTGT